MWSHREICNISPVIAGGKSISLDYLDKKVVIDRFSESHKIVFL